LSIILIFVPVMGVIFTWVGVQNQKHTMNQVLNQARILARQIILTRQWISDAGGVWVDSQSKGARGINFTKIEAKKIEWSFARKKANGIDPRSYRNYQSTGIG